MKVLAISIVSILLFSCAAPKLSTTRKLESLGIECNYDAEINYKYKASLDLAIDETINKFNKEGHSFSIHRRQSADNAYISYDFSNFKIASNGKVLAGWIVSGIGLLVAPVATVALSESTYFLAFWYFPKNKLDYVVQPSPYLNSKYKFVPASIVTGAMWRSKSNRIAATVRNFQDAFYNQLIDLEKQSRGVAYR